MLPFFLIHFGSQSPLSTNYLHCTIIQHCWFLQFQHNKGTTFPSPFSHLCMVIILFFLYLFTFSPFFVLKIFIFIIPVKVCLLIGLFLFLPWFIISFVYFIWGWKKKLNFFFVNWLSGCGFLFFVIFFVSAQPHCWELSRGRYWAWFYYVFVEKKVVRKRLIEKWETLMLSLDPTSAIVFAFHCNIQVLPLSS